MLQVGDAFVNTAEAFTNILDPGLVERRSEGAAEGWCFHFLRRGYEEMV